MSSSFQNIHNFFSLKIFFLLHNSFYFSVKGQQKCVLLTRVFLVDWTLFCDYSESFFRLFLLSPRFFFLSVPDKNYCCAKRHLLAVSAPTEADRRVLLSSANAEKRPLSCQGPYCVLKWFLHLLPASSPIFETHPFYCRTQLSGVSKISSTVCTQRCN